MKKTKHERVREHLLSGKTLTQLEATNLYHTTRLGGIVHTLRHREGYTIDDLGPERGKNYSIYKMVLAEQTEMDLNGAA